MKKYFKKEITNETEAKNFLYELYKDDIGFHPESDPRDIIKAGDEGFVFTLEQCRYLDLRLEEIYKYMEDPCKYIMEVLYTIFATTKIKE